MRNSYRMILVLLFLITSLFYKTNIFPKTQAAGKTCGNGVCQPSLSEDVNSCPADCSPVPTSPPAPTQTPVPTPQPTAPPNPTQGTNPTQAANPTSEPNQETSGSSPTQTSSNDSTSTSSNTQSDKIPTINLTSYPSLTSIINPSIAGITTVEQSSISFVEYSLDGGEWIKISAQDGFYNSFSELFQFTLPQLKDGEYHLDIRVQAANGKSSTRTIEFTVSTVPPEIKLDLILPNPSEDTTPTVTGTITITANPVVRVQASLDGGKSWFNALLRGKQFSYTFDELEDGNYQIIARAFDAAGNSAESKTQTLVIDTLPPILGGSFFAIQSQDLPINHNGVVYVPVGREIQHIVSTKGGVISINSNTIQATYTPTSRTNIFSGNLVFETPGEYQLELTAQDGAENIQTRTVSTIAVVSQGLIQDKSGKAISDSQITVYYFNTYLNAWRKWDNTIYGGENPTRSKNGKYNLILPSGKYYVKVTASGYRSYYSNIFELNTTTIIQSNIVLSASSSLPLFSTFLDSVLPTFGALDVENHTVNDSKLPKLSENQESTPLISKDGSEINIEDLLSQNETVVLTFFSSWSTKSLEQIAVLDEVSRENLKVKLYGVSVQDSPINTRVLMLRGGYNFDFVVDETGLVAQEFGVSTLPYHVIVKNKKIDKIYVGTLNKSEYNKFIGQ